jgi:phosphopantothenoylcysteine decarboxylase
VEAAGYDEAVRILEEWGFGGGEEAKGKGSQEGWFEVLRLQEVGDGAVKDWKEIVKVIEEKLRLGSGE